MVIVYGYCYDYIVMVLVYGVIVYSDGVIVLIVCSGRFRYCFALVAFF